MHIAIVRRHCSLKRAGAERYCVNLFRGLQRLGHRVTVVGEGIDEELRSEVEFLPVPVNRLTSWTRNRSFSENCAKLVRSHNFDIVHGLSRVDGLDTFRLTDPMQTHWVKVWYRNPISQWFQQMNPRHRAIFELEKRLYRSSGVRRIIVQSKLDARLLTEYFEVDESRIRRIVNGVDTRVFHPGVRSERTFVRDQLFRQFGVKSGPDGAVHFELPPSIGTNLNFDSREQTKASLALHPQRQSADIDSTPLIVFASMDFRRKGLDSLLSAIAKVKERETRLLVLGAGDIEGYRRIAKSLGIDHRVLFAGRQSSIQRFYGAGDLFVLPTVYEPFPNVNLEAMACGTPVITTATAGGADIIVPGQNGYVIPDAWAINELTERIDQFFALPSSARASMSNSCWETAAKLRVEDNAQQVASLFEEVRREKNAA